MPNREGERERVTPSPPRPLTPSPVAIKQVNGSAQFLEDNQTVRFQLGGQMATGGSIAIQGESRLKTEQTNLQLQAQNVLAADVTRLVQLPLEIQAGLVDGNLKIQLLKSQELRIFGTAGLKAVQGKIDQLPQPFIITQGTLSFQGTQVRLENVSTSYGKITAIANGSIDTEAGYNLFARVKAVSLASAQQTLELELPVPATAEVRADVQITGPIFQPILSGTVKTTKPARIDRVNFSTIRSRFAFSTAASEITFKDIQATPTADCLTEVGGSQWQRDLGEKGQRDMRG